MAASRESAPDADDPSSAASATNRISGLPVVVVRGETDAIIRLADGEIDGAQTSWRALTTTPKLF